jgi:hypothetical protein
VALPGVADWPMGPRYEMLVLEPASRCGALNPAAVNELHGDLSQTVREFPVHVASHPRGCRCELFWDVKSKSMVRPSRANSHDQALFFAAFSFAHLAFCAAATFFLAAADTVRLLLIGTIFRVFRALAHRAR